MNDPRRGDRVVHPVWGPGVVVERLVGERVRVAFDTQPEFPRTLLRAQLVITLAADGRDLDVPVGTGAHEPAEVPHDTGVPGETPRDAADADSATPSDGADAGVARPGAVEVAPVPDAAAQAVTHAVTQADPDVAGTSTETIEGATASAVGASDASDASAAAPAAAIPPLALAPEDAWQALEALRLGVVPPHGVREYTVARARELASIAELVDAGRGCRIVWGDYGAGKTHMLDASEQLAFEHGFATARITLDPRGNALHHPLRLYRKIAESIRMPGRANPGLEGIFERLLESPAHTEPRGARASRFFTPFLHVLKHGDAEQVGWLRDYVGGDDIGADEVNEVLTDLGWRGARILRMSDFRTYGRMYVHLVGTLACWCADAGAKGLVLLFDEVERIEALSREDRGYALEVLRHYAAVTLPRADLQFDPEALYKGGQEVHRQIPLRFADDQPLSAVFALTPLEEIEQSFASVTESKAYDIRLDPLTGRNLGELVRRIAGVYTRAHPEFAPAPELLDGFRAQIGEHLDEGHDSFRGAVRAAVFLLDGERLRPRAT